MLWLKVVAVYSVVTAAAAINRPVYKVVLTQKGFAQFLQYDLETPPLLEFTFCTWIRLYDLSQEQTVLSYIVKSNRNMVRLWIDSGGRNVQLAINGWLATTSPIEMVKDVWKHVCISYQSDFGAWALYVDARLVTCGASRALQGFILPQGGSVNIGYGTTDNGAPSGIEGEVFGANMILTSTIERNYTMKHNPKLQQRYFSKNKVKGTRGDNEKYVVLNNLKKSTVRNTFDKNTRSPFSRTNWTTSFNGELTSIDTSKDSDDLAFSSPFGTKITTSDPMSVQFWNLVKDTSQERSERNREPFNSETQGLPTVSEFETPPPPTPVYNINFLDDIKKEQNSIKVAKNIEKSMISKNNEISEVETPPPEQSDKNVYGQWVSSNFAANILNHLRSMQMYKKDIIKSPPTIPLHKTYDAFPYASEFKLTKLKPPSEFKRRSSGENDFYQKVFARRRSQAQNLQILEDDIRGRILKSHSRVKPLNIDVINKGESTITHDRFNRQAEETQSQSSESSESIEIENTPQPFTVSRYKKFATVHNAQTKKQATESQTETSKLKNLLTILPLLKSLEDLIDDSHKTDLKNKLKSDIYTRSLSTPNKWHNTKSYSNDYTPRRVPMEADAATNYVESKVADTNVKYPAVNLKFKHKGNEKVDLSTKYSPMIMESDTFRPTIAIGHRPSVPTPNFIFEKSKEREISNSNLKSNLNSTSIFKINNFDKPVKIGNALNERYVIGKNDVQKKRSFEGGDARVPDINKYRSDIDKENGGVPPSLNLKICKNVELFDRILYIQPDESVDLAYFYSPVKLKNPSIEFIQQNFKLCSLDGSVFEKDPLLYLDWNKTPVRLFGGAYLQPTTDLCGFF